MEKNIGCKCFLLPYRKSIEESALKKEELGNCVLYGMCNKHSTHANHPDDVLSKVWLIGRAYAAAIERRKKKFVIRGEGNDAFYKRVGKKLADQKIDDKLEKLKKYDKITDDLIPDILSTHNYLMERIKELTGMNKRSLCSKYLHFHVPNLFFIYDVRANTEIKKIYRKRWNNQKYTTDRDYDREYAEFFKKAFALQIEIEKCLPYLGKITPRKIDNFLIKIANENSYPH